MLAKHFESSGYTVLRSALQESERSFLFDYLVGTLGRPGPVKGDSLVPQTPAIYGDFAMEGLLEKMLPVFEQTLNLTLFPTYSYARLYKNGDALPRHKDRHACEISGSLCLGYAPADASPWPICLEHDGSPVSIALRPGDMLIYKGIELPHWRAPFEGECLAQVFLHYVDQLGGYREWKFDKRPGLRMPAARRASS